MSSDGEFVEFLMTPPPSKGNFREEFLPWFSKVFNILILCAFSSPRPPLLEKIEKACTQSKTDLPKKKTTFLKSC